MNMQRRTVLKKTAAGCGLALAATAGLFRPLLALAEWPKAAFDSKTIGEAGRVLLGGVEATPSDQITLKAPDIAENGAVVPVSVSTSLANVESISILVENNPSPLAASFEISPQAIADVATRIKMGETSNVIALVKADGKAYSVSKEVKVTIGGCGG